MNDADRIRDAFVQLWGSMGPFWGVPPMTARVYGWLLAQPEPQTADRIVEGLSMSRGAVSMATRELRDWGLIHATREPGSRRTAYSPENDLEKAIRNIVQTRKRREWDPILEHLEAWIPELDRQRTADARVFRERLQSIAELVSAADRIAEILLSGGMVQRLGLKTLVKAAGRPHTKKDKS